MALQVTNLQRKFIIKNEDKKDIELKDPNPDMTPEEVIKFYSSEYPELTTASLSGPTVKGEVAVYSASAQIGTKG